MTQLIAHIKFPSQFFFHIMLQKILLCAFLSFFLVFKSRKKMSSDSGGFLSKNKPPHKLNKFDKKLTHWMGLIFFNNRLSYLFQTLKYTTLNLLLKVTLLDKTALDCDWVPWFVHETQTEDKTRAAHLNQNKSYSRMIKTQLLPILFKFAICFDPIQVLYLPFCSCHRKIKKHY